MQGRYGNDTARELPTPADKGENGKRVVCGRGKPVDSLLPVASYRIRLHPIFHRVVDLSDVTANRKTVRVQDDQLEHPGLSGLVPAGVCIGVRG